MKGDLNSPPKRGGRGGLARKKREGIRGISLRSTGAPPLRFIRHPALRRGQPMVDPFFGYTKIAVFLARATRRVAPTISPPLVKGGSGGIKTFPYVPPHTQLYTLNSQIKKPPSKGGELWKCAVRPGLIVASSRDATRKGNLNRLRISLKPTSIVALHAKEQITVVICTGS